MGFLNNRTTQRAVLVAVMLAALIYALCLIRSYTQQRLLATRGQLPPDGLSRYDTKGLVPGNPKNGEQQLKHLYAMYQTYKKLHGGQMPSDVLTMIQDCWSRRSDYGFANNAEINEYLKNPDQQYADDEGLRNHPNGLSFGCSETRVDGTPTFSNKPRGTRDVIAYTTTYLHRNERNFPGMRQTINPVGYYLVLWDDGQVEKVAYDKALFAYGADAKKGYDTVFAGQAGIGNHIMDYDTHWKQMMHWPVPPHGVAGGKGTSYNGQSYR